MTDPSADLARLDAMLQAGQINQADYAVARAQLLGQAPPQQYPAYQPPQYPGYQPPSAGPQGVFTPQAYNPTVLPGGSSGRSVYRTAYSYGPGRLVRRLVLGFVPLVIVIVAIVIVAVVVNNNTKTPSVAVPSISIPPISIPAFSVPALPGGVNSFAGTGKAPAHVGDTIVIKDDDNHPVSVTLLKVVTTAKATDHISTPDTGQRYFAAELRISIAATGDAYSDDPGFASEALDSAGHQYDNAGEVEKISSGPIFSEDTNIAPGHAALGWIVFEVPKATTVTGVQFFLDGGAGAGAQWSVP